MVVAYLCSLTDQFAIMSLFYRFDMRQKSRTYSVRPYFVVVRSPLYHELYLKLAERDAVYGLGLVRDRFSEW